MKKIVLTLAGALAVTAFAPEAAAVPSFARQTGMACSACHFQHFPVLNSFGMAFKSSGYTMMGAQEKVEGEHLSLPNTLNASVLLKLRYQKTSTRSAAPELSGASSASGQWQFPDESSLFIAGRVAENVGTFAEFSLSGAVNGGQPVTAFSALGAPVGVAAAGGTSLIAAMKVPFMFDMGGAKVGVIPFFSTGAGPAFGYELSSNAVVRAIRWTEHPDSTAPEYFGFGGGAATGLAFVARNDMGYINLTRFSPTSQGAGGANIVQFRNNWLRIAATPTYADWNMHIGLGVASGGSEVAGTPALPVRADTKLTLLDFQGQTQLGGKDFSLYANYGRAPSTATGVNIYNPALTGTRTAFGIAADYSVIPHVLHIGAGFLRGDTGAALANKNNNWQLNAIYDVAQNVALHLVHSNYSGSANAGAGATTNKTTAMLEAAW